MTNRHRHNFEILVARDESCDDKTVRFKYEDEDDGVFMSSHALMWAAVPHNSDGVVFQIRLIYGLQRFYVSRSVLEQAFDLERKASDARQLEVFYARLKSIVAAANARRSIAGLDTVALSADDFPVRANEPNAAHAEPARSSV